MQSHRRLEKATSLATILVLACLIASTVGSAAGQTTLKIEKINRIGGKVCFTVRNIGNETAYNLTTTIHITGGILHRINITSTCNGGCGCNTTLTSNSTATRCVRVLGLGSIVITVSAKAVNAPEVTATATGFVIGHFVIINK
ncbi:MAG TPA: hypothetical protein VMT57_04955 [Candidatus Thermoplasmatota archaeon]|nr:hypothetical protein [Candidatus Thermoplasmatota archaeon]